MVMNLFSTKDTSSESIVSIAENKQFLFIAYS